MSSLKESLQDTGEVPGKSGHERGHKATGGTGMATSIVVFTRDLRVHDNPALAAAAIAGDVVPLFVIDDVIMGRHGHNEARMAFLGESLADLDDRLRSKGGRLVIKRGPWAKTIADLAATTSARDIHLADDVSGYARRRLDRLESFAAEAGAQVTTHPGVTVAGPASLTPASGGPYQVFTPYYRRWADSPRRAAVQTPRSISLPDGLDSSDLPAAITTAKAGITPGGESAGLSRLKNWSARALADYDEARDDLAAAATSRLSAYLHFGCLSPLAVESALHGKPGAEPYLRQLAWRDFFCQLLAARPDAAHDDLRTRGDQWHDDAEGLAAWQAGQTGFPVVDAAMRQLTSEGFMHNRARMIVASFLTKDLYIDWRAGADHFLAYLADADLASNQLNWQWVAGTGTDTQRHRIFNPTVQSTRFDPRGEYIARYVPELAGLESKEIHDPSPAERTARRYPRPIVDHKAAAAAWHARQQRGPRTAVR
jgi:deoxyribodipyrimidine photo-lyase